MIQKLNVKFSLCISYLIVNLFFILNIHAQPILSKKLQKELSEFVWIDQKTEKHVVLGTYLEPEPGSKPLDLKLPEHYEPITDTFLFQSAFVSKTEVTAAQYALFLKDSLQLARNDSNAIRLLLPDCNREVLFPNYCMPESNKLIKLTQYSQYPVVCVNYTQVSAYCTWLTNRLNRLILSDKNTPAFSFEVRVPSDLEYEFLMGKDLSSIRDNCGAFPIGLGNNPQLTESDGFMFLNPVRAFPANSLGLFGLYGNASEWAQDDLGQVIARDIQIYRAATNELRDNSLINIPTPVEDPQNYEELYTQFDGIKVVKGGSYCTTPARANGATRGACPSNQSRCWLGFRPIINIIHN